MAQFREIVTKLLESRSFFALSGIVDANYAPSYSFKNGEPVTVEAYHMTPHTFTKFKIGQVNAWGEGVYLTNNPEDCSFNPETIKNWNKMRLFATFFKPFIYEDKIGDEFRNWLWFEIQKITNEETLNKSEILKHKYSFEKSCMDVYYRLLFKNAIGTAFKNQSSLNVINTIKHYDDLYKLNIYDKLGLDGMILPFGKTGMVDQSNKNTVWYVCYKPNQIKSYEGNNGNYSLESDDINESHEVNNLNDNFWKWFNGSKIVDSEGNPQVCYHGTPNSFTVFNKALKGTFSHGEGAGVGFWFSTTPVYALNHRNQMSVYLSIKNPKIFKTGKYSHTELEYMRNLYNKEKDYDEKYYIYKLTNCISSREDAYEHFLLDLYNSNNQIPINQNFYGDLRDIVKLENPQQAYDNYISKLNSEGYDGIMIVNTSYDRELAKGRNTQIIAFEPNQIKSIYNNGNWSLTSNDINESIDNSFYEYSNTDKNAIGFSGVNTYAEQGDSYTMIVDMSPQEFLSLSTVNFIKDDIPWFEEQVKNGVPLAMPYLEIEIEDPKKKIARVYGHEGRHRSLAVSNLGYTQAQCILWIRDFIRAGYKKEDLIGWTIMGQKPRIGNKNTHENNSFVIK